MVQTAWQLPLVVVHERYRFLLFVNVFVWLDKTIKLWKVYEKTVKVPAEQHQLYKAPQAGPVLKLPKMAVSDSFIAAQPKKIYGNAHTYHINSISINSDGETFISADDLRINLWNLGISDQSFSNLEFCLTSH
jgi:serine/threonine-protein phosphatase 2A regulatory subunit B